MKPVWLICVALLAAACGRPESPKDGGDASATAGVVAESGVELQARQPVPGQKPPEVPGVERLVDLSGGRSPADYLKAVEKFMRDNPDLQVIVGAGWERRVFAAAPPHKEQLDQINDLIPIVLFARDGGSAWVNSEALAAAGIDVDTSNPPGGVIDRDEGGLPNGLMHGAAVELIERIIPRKENTGDSPPGR